MYAYSESASFRDIHVKEWRLVYSPQNPVLNRLVDTAANSLGLNGTVGVSTSDELVGVMFNRELIAGIEFKHPTVCSIFTTLVKVRLCN